MGTALLIPYRQGADTGSGDTKSPARAVFAGDELYVVKRTPVGPVCGKRVARPIRVEGVDDVNFIVHRVLQIIGM